MLYLLSRDIKSIERQSQEQSQKIIDSLLSFEQLSLLKIFDEDVIENLHDAHRMGYHCWYEFITVEKDTLESFEDQGLPEEEFKIDKVLEKAILKGAKGRVIFTELDSAVEHLKELFIAVLSGKMSIEQARGKEGHINFLGDNRPEIIKEYKEMYSDWKIMLIDDDRRRERLENIQNELSNCPYFEKYYNSQEDFKL